MICVDNDKEIVAKNVLEFFGAALPGATSALANDPRMSAQELGAAVEALAAHLAAGDFNAVRALGIPDFSWVQPGHNKIAGAHVGKAFASLAGRLPELGAPGFTAFGTPVLNRGVASSRRRWRTRRSDARVAGLAPVRVARGQAAGAPLVRRRGRARGRVLWADPTPRQRSVRARAGIRGGDRRVANAAQGAGQRHAARALFAVQAGERGRRHRRAPRRARHGGRAKYDAWAKRKGAAATTRCASTSRWSRI